MNCRWLAYFYPKNCINFPDGLICPKTKRYKIHLSFYITRIYIHNFECTLNVGSDIQYWKDFGIQRVLFGRFYPKPRRPKATQVRRQNQWIIENKTKIFFSFRFLHKISRNNRMSQVVFKFWPPKLILPPLPTTLLWLTKVGQWLVLEPKLR